MNKQIGFKIFADGAPGALEEKVNEYVQKPTSPKVLASQISYADGVYTVMLTVEGFIGEEIL